MKGLLGYIIAALLTVVAARAQTTVIAQPVADAKGEVAFEIVRVVRIEGKWKTPPRPGMLLYPEGHQKAYPLGRFGEAVVIAFEYNGSYQHWWGYHVYDGYIPGLNGESLADLIQEVERKAAPAASPAVATVATNRAVAQVQTPVVGDDLAVGRIQKLRSLGPSL